MRLLLWIIVGCFFGWYSAKAFSQTQTTPNIVNGTWNGAVTVTNIQQFGCCSGGPQPAYSTSDNTLHFSYGGYTAYQIYAINQALSGSGVQIKGYNYSWNVLNTGEASGNLYSWIWLTSPTGQLHEYYFYDLSADTQGTWKNYSGTQNFTQNYQLSNVGTLGIQFYGYDNRYWAGYYGPKVKDVSVTLNYTADQCVTNPQSSPTCPGYVASPTIVTSPVVQTTITSTPTTTTTVTAANPAAPVQLVATPTVPTQTLMTETPKQTKSQSESKPASAKTVAKRETQSTEKATSMEQQVAAQENAISTMAFVPGFDKYQGLKLVDVNGLQLQRQYGKDVVDNRRLNRGLFGATDRTHQDMVNSQYQLGN